MPRSRRALRRRLRNWTRMQLNKRPARTRCSRRCSARPPRAHNALGRTAEAVERVGAASEGVLSQHETALAGFQAAFASDMAQEQVKSRMIGPLGACIYNLAGVRLPLV